MTDNSTIRKNTTGSYVCQYCLMTVGTDVHRCAGGWRKCVIVGDGGGIRVAADITLLDYDPNHAPWWKQVLGIAP